MDDMIWFSLTKYKRRNKIKTYKCLYMYKQRERKEHDEENKVWKMVGMFGHAALLTMTAGMKVSAEDTDIQKNGTQSPSNIICV